MKTFYLCRNEDVSLTSGTGRVAEAVEFDDGAIAVRWIGNMNASGVSSTTLFNSIEDMMKVHGHQGRTVLEPDLDHERFEWLETRLQKAMDLLRAHGIPAPAD